MRLDTRSHTVSAILAALLLATASSANEHPGAGEQAASVANGPKVHQFDDWQLRCTVQSPPSRADNPSASACEIGQPLMVDVDGKPVELLNLAVTRANDKAGEAKWAMVILTPLDVQLNADFGLVIGTAEPVVLRYRNCNRLGCFVIAPLDDRRIRQMERAAAGAVYFRLLDGKAVKVSFSLKGFTKAMARLSSGVATGDVATDDQAPSAAQSGDGGN